MAVLAINAEEGSSGFTAKKGLEGIERISVLRDVGILSLSGDVALREICAQQNQTKSQIRHIWVQDLNNNKEKDRSLIP